jgi:hypothetical protein
LVQYKDGTHVKKKKCGTLTWLKNNLVHRDEDKPAAILPSDTLAWYQNGKQHRDGDKPAIISLNGTLEWWQNDKRHRLCGPAAINSDGTPEWWVNGKNITTELNTWLADQEWQGTPEQITEFQLRFS